jgi:hypothetical protein
MIGNFLAAKRGTSVTSFVDMPKLSTATKIKQLKMPDEIDLLRITI